MTKEQQEKFFEDVNPKDGRADGLNYLTEDLDNNDVPDVFQGAYNKLRFSMIWGYIGAALFAVLATLLADWIGKILGLH